MIAASWPDLENRLSSLLRSGCNSLAVIPDEAQFGALLEYLQLLQKWNRSYNLTAVREPEAMVTRHLLDSLAVAPYLRGQLFIDVGTGGGLPGVPLSILFSGRQFHLLDSNGKKTRFLFQVKTALGLDNMTVQHARVEAFQPDVLFDAVLSRAFASLEDMVRGCRHLLAPGGSFLAMKGVDPVEEIAAVRLLCQTPTVHPIDVPGLAEQRHLVEMQLRQDVAQQ